MTRAARDGECDGNTYRPSTHGVTDKNAADKADFVDLLYDTR